MSSLRPRARQHAQDWVVESCLLLCKYTTLFRPMTPMVERFARKTGFEVVEVDTNETEYESDKRVAKQVSAKDLWAYRPPRGIAHGIVRALRNAILAVFCPSLMCIGSPITRGFQEGIQGYFVGLANCVVWAPLMCLVGMVGAVQQMWLGIYVTLAAPKRLGMDGHRWHPVACKYVQYSMARDRFLEEEAPTPDVLLRIACTRNRERLERSRGRGARGQGNDDDGRGGGQEGNNFRSADLYRVLGVERKATDRQIKEAYSRLALELHPDRNPDPAAKADFDSVTKAYKVLSNKKKRKEYDTGANVQDGEIAPKKRDGLTLVFGGKEFHKIIGDMRATRMQRRMIDEALFYGQEIFMFNLWRMQEQPKNLLHYLDGYELENPPQGEEEHRSEASAGATGGEDTAKTDDSSSTATNKTKTTSSSKAKGDQQKTKSSLHHTQHHSHSHTRTQHQSTVESAETANKKWRHNMQKKITKLGSEGLGTSVLYLVGQHYLDAVQFVESSALERTQLYFDNNVVKRAEDLIRSGRALAISRREDRSKADHMVNTMWIMCIPDLREACRFVALTVLLDATADGREKLRRKEALKELGMMMRKAGRPYTGADPRVLANLQAAMAGQSAKSKDR